jgi:hypothetical protein
MAETPMTRAINFIRRIVSLSRGIPMGRGVHAIHVLPEGVTFLVKR